MPYTDPERHKEHAARYYQQNRKKLIEYERQRRERQAWVMVGRMPTTKWREAMDLGLSIVYLPFNHLFVFEHEGKRAVESLKDDLPTW